MNTLSEWMKPELIWFLAGLVMLVLEFAMPGLIIFFFGAGAILVAIICLFFDIPVNAQLGIFLVSSLLLLLLLRRYIKPIFTGHVSSRQNVAENLEEFLGERVTVTTEIAENRKGRVEFRGTHWGAVADEVVPAGTLVEIVGSDNITLKVKPLKRSE